MSELIVPGVLHRETEFAEVLPGVRVFGACGPNALSEVASNAQGAVKHTSDVYWLMRNAGLCDSEGVTTLSGLANAATDHMGLHQVAYRGYADPPWNGWQTFFEQYAGVAPFVAQVIFGQALVDAITGQGENAKNLRSHFICVLGRNTGGWSPRANRSLPAGYWCADGCSFAGGNNNGNGFNAADVLQFYPDDVMAQADPHGALVIKGATPMAWHKQADNTARDDAGHSVGVGMAATILANAALAASDGLLGETYYGAHESFAPLSNGVIVSWDGSAVHTDRAAQVLVAVYAQLEAAKKQPPPPAPASLVIAAGGQSLTVNGDTATLTVTAK